MHQECLNLISYIYMHLKAVQVSQVHLLSISSLKGNHKCNVNMEVKLSSVCFTVKHVK